MVSGYEPKRWFWEPVIFLRKAACFAVEVIPLSQAGRIQTLLLLAALFATAHVIWNPYDMRANELLNRLEWYQLALWVACCLGLMLVDIMMADWSIIVVPGLLVLWHFVYTFLVFYHIVNCLLMHFAHNIHESKSNAADQDGFVASIKHALLRWYKTQTLSQPYVALDFNYGWVSICGNRGDEAVPPYIPKGRDAAKFHGGRPTLSQAPTVPPRLEDKTYVKTANLWHRLELQRMIMIAIDHIIGDTPIGTAFSVSLLDFVVRAAFVLVRSSRTRYDQLTSGAEEIDKRVLIAAKARRDPILLVGRKPGDDAADEGGGANENNEAVLSHLALGKLMEEDLRRQDAGMLFPKSEEQDEAAAEAALAAEASHHDDDNEDAHNILGALAQASSKRKSHHGREKEQRQQRLELAARVITTARSTANAAANVVTTAVHQASDTAHSATAVVASQAKTAAKSAASTAASTAAQGLKSAAATSKAAMSLNAASFMASPREDSETESDKDVENGVVEDEDEGEKSSSSSGSSGGGSPGGGAENKGRHRHRRKAAGDAQVEEEDSEKVLENLVKERYAGFVYDMFAESTFRRGLQLREMQFALMRLIALPGSELLVWLDLFERSWVHEKVTAGRGLTRAAGHHVEAMAQADEMEYLMSQAPASARSEASSELTDMLHESFRAVGAVQEARQLRANKELGPRSAATIEARVEARWCRLALKMNGISLFKVSGLGPLMQQRFCKARKDIEAALEMQREWRQEEESRAQDVAASLVQLDSTAGTSI